MSDADALGALTDADRWLDKLRKQREHLAEEEQLRAIEHDLRELADQLRAFEAQRRPVRDAFHRATEEVNALKGRKDALDERLRTMTGAPRDAAALHDEVGRVGVALSEAEDREVALLLELEPLDLSVEAVRTAAQPLAEQRAELQRTIAELRASLDDELAHHRARRAELAGQLPPELYKRYESALARAGVSGAARLENGRCDGCRVALPELDIERARRLPEGQFANCSHCGRLLLC